MRISQRRSRVEVVEGTAWMVKARRTDHVMAHRAMLRMTGTRRSDAVVTSSGLAMPFSSVPWARAVAVDATVERPRTSCRMRVP